MRRLDSRRLTGPNLHIHGPAAISEVAFEPDDDPDACITAWVIAVSAALTALGWPIELAVRRHSHPDGRTIAELVFAAPHDHLLLATDINDWAIAAAAHDHLPDPSGPLATWRDQDRKSVV